jgi:hypothetical protein
MHSLTIRNLKSITNSGSLKIRPITAFVGQNSSGKSSLIRCIPLLKQSTESKTLGTVLWSGKYVDYGSFNESLNFSAKNSGLNEEISFTFEFKVTPADNRGSYLPVGTEIKLTIRVSGDEYSKSSYTVFEYEIYGSTFLIKYNSELKILQLLINGNDFTKSANDYFRTFKTYSAIPFLYPTQKPVLQGEQITSALVKELKKHVHHRVSDSKISNIASVLRFGDDNHIKRSLTNKNLVGEYGAGKMSNWSGNNLHFQKIKDQILLCGLNRIVDQVSDYLQSYFMSSRYITPLRAAADRYYRVQNTSIEELDPNGSNLAMFLHAKKKEEIEEINSWLKSEIGFTIEILSSQGHASILIIDENGLKSNIADTGFGFSQVLPILIQVWQLSKKRARRYSPMIVPVTVIIEQPELHLHPKMQSRVGDAFCKAIKIARQNEVDLRFIIETHSKDIIQAIGKCIEEEIISSDDVSIYIVEKNNSENVKASYFDKQGYLTHWPYGFFDGE